MITKLTKKQQAMISVIRDEWLDRLFSCKNRTNREEATKYINWLYEFCGCKKPIIMFLSSPMGIQYGANIAPQIFNKYLGKEIYSKIDSEIYSKIGSEIYSKIGSEINSEIYSKIGSEIYSEIGSKIGSKIGSEIDSEIYSKIYSNIGSEIDSEINSNIGSEIDSEIGSKINSEIGSKINSEIGSKINSEIGSKIDSKRMYYFSRGWEGTAHYWSWYAYLDSYKQLKLLDESVFEKHNNLVALAKSNCFDMIQLDGLCIVSDMPVSIRRNAGKQLHSTTDMAIKFADGWGLYYINGVAFNEELFRKVTDPGVSPKDIFAIPNQEQRRVAYEILDKTKMKQLNNYKVVDSVDDDGYGNPMKIFEFSVDGFNRPFRYVNWFCSSTRREYFHDISGTDITDCWEAKRNSFRIGEKIEIVKEY